MKTTDELITVEQLFNQSIDTVWQAITNHGEMIQWYFENIPEFIPKVGFRTQFNVKAPSRDFLHIWTVVEVMPNKKITYNWNYEGLEGDANVTFELFQLENKSKLVLSMEIIEDFDSNIPEFKRESCMAGWHYFINERLSVFINND